MNRSTLLSTTAPAPRWTGEIRIFWTIPELRALGLGWKQIERDAMTREVRFDDEH